MEDLNIDNLEFSGSIDSLEYLAINNSDDFTTYIDKEDAIKIIAHLQGVFEL